jgi:hypothetical protein
VKIWDLSVKWGLYLISNPVQHSIFSSWTALNNHR